MNKSSIIKKIKEKRELSGIDNTIVEELLENYFKKRKVDFEELTKSDIRIVVKDIRAELRIYTGQYIMSQKDRLKLFEQNKISELLKTHSSTAERIPFYPSLRKIIRDLGVKSILDLACGLNPIGLADKTTTYHASDINEKDLELVSKYFKKHKIRGEVSIYNIKKIKYNLPSSELCLLFKILDLVDKKGHKTAEKILITVPCEKILVSFPTKKLTGRPMKQPKRFWFENMLNRLGYEYKIIESDNEIFYLITKYLSA